MEARWQTQVKVVGPSHAHNGTGDSCTRNDPRGITYRRSATTSYALSSRSAMSSASHPVMNCEAFSAWSSHAKNPASSATAER